MQELISHIAALGIEITPTTSLIIIFGIILLTAIVSPVGLYPARDYRQCAGGFVAAKRQ